MIVSLLAVSLLVVLPAAAVSQAEWDAVKAAEAKKAKDFAGYKTVKAQAEAAEAAGDWVVASDLHIAAAQGAHCNRGDTGWVKAWRLNSAAWCLIKANEKKGYSTEVDTLERILALLAKARAAGPNKKCLAKIERNESWAQERLPK